MAIEFYYFSLSPPSRAVWMVLEEMGLKYNKNLVDLMSGKHKTDEYKKINPRQKLPALKDGDFCVGESRAIAQYLVTKYGAQQNQQSLYPTDPHKRATVDQHLYISEIAMEQIVSYVNMPGVLFRGEEEKEENFVKAKAAVQGIEDALALTKFTAGNDFTLADIFYYMAVAFLDVVDFDWSEYPKVTQWKATIASQPWFKEVWADNQAKLVELYNSKKGTAKKA